MNVMTLSNSLGEGYVMESQFPPTVYFDSSTVYEEDDRTVTVYDDADPNPYDIARAEITVYKDRDYATLDFYVAGSTEPVISITGTRHNAAWWEEDIGGFMDGDMVLNGYWTIYGTKYDDVLIAGNARVTFHGNEGDDQLTGGISRDTIFGGAGNDQIYGEAYGFYESQGDELRGGGGNDDIVGSLGDDTILARAETTCSMPAISRNLFRRATAFRATRSMAGAVTTIFRVAGRTTPLRAIQNGSRR